ncbi:MAG: hypothetical protein R3A78_08790 [Polyangiales bacterium]|nr:hypothetical protein [Myxococcales bacterium]
MPRTNTLLPLTLLAAAALGGCASESAAMYEVKSAASSDLACNESALEFIVDRPFEKVVRGCGQTLRYARQCGGRRATGSCVWMAYPVDYADAAEMAASAKGASNAKAATKPNGSLGIDFSGGASAGGSASADGAAAGVEGEATGDASGDAASADDEL